MTNEISVHREIHAPAEQLWAMVSDIARMGEWSPETTTCSWIKGASGPVAGAKFKGANENGKKKWSTVCTVIEAELGKAFAFRVDVGLLKVAEWAYRFEPATAGDGCIVTETWTDRRSGLVKMLGKPLSGVEDRSVHNKAGMEQTLERLAAAAEASAG